MWRFVITCKSLLLLLVLIPILAHSQFTLSQQVSENDSSNSQMTLNVLWNIFGLRLPDRIIILSLCPILLVFQIIIIVMFLRHTSLLIKPGNVFFVLVLIEAGLNIHLIVTAIYHTINQSSQVPENYPTICSGFGYAQALFEINHISYLYIFLFYVVFTIRHTLKKKTKTFWVIIHLIIFLCCLGITNYLYFEQFIGLNFTGICGITSLFKLNMSVDWNILPPVFGILFIIFFFGFGIFAFQYYKKHMPQGQLKNRKSQYSGIILLFVVGFSICQVVPNLCCLVLAISYNQGKSVQSLHPFISLTNLVRVIEYYFTIFLIVWNSQFRNKLKFMFKKIINSCCLCNKNMQKSSSINEDNLRTKLQLSQIIVNEKLLKIKESSNQIDLLFVSQIYTILSGVYAIFYEYFNMSPQNKTQVKEPKPINYKESITIQVDKQSMKKYQFQTRMMLQLQILKCRLIFFFPKVFLNLLVSDGLFNIFQSFGIFENAQKILSTAADGQGGKSGEFFFFTADRKYVLKTITQEQFQFLKSHMVDFYDHYKYNPQSVLAKIYGLMIFKGDQIQRTYRLILMKNIMGCQRQQIERVYDIKGSTYDREVVTTKKEGYFLQQLTLKDIDFIKYEGKLHIDDQKSHILRMIIKKDAQFLKNLNLIDYSFLVVKAKWDRRPENPNFWGEYQRIVHHQKPNYYYHIGIIDYLQLWDLQKKGESFWKKITLKKGISAVNPTNYCIRFLNFIDQISINFESSARAEQAISNIQQVYQKMLKQKQLEKNKPDIENQRQSESN